MTTDPIQHVLDRLGAATTAINAAREAGDTAKALKLAREANEDLADHLERTDPSVESLIDALPHS